MNFYENNYINPSDIVQINDNIIANDYMCKHCNKIKLSMYVIDRLSELKNALNTDIYVIQGYMCENLCFDNNDNINNSHTLGVAADISFGGKFDLIDIFDVLVSKFPQIGIIKSITNEYYVHLQYSDKCLYWLCDKNENDNLSEYVYFRDNMELKNFIISKNDIFDNIKI